MQTPPNSPRRNRQPEQYDDDDIPQLMPLHWPFWHMFGYWLWPDDLVGDV